MYIIIDKTTNKIKQTIDKNYGIKTNRNELLQEVTEQLINKFYTAREYELIFKGEKVTDIKILKTWEEWQKEQPKQEIPKTKEELQVEEIEKLKQELKGMQQAMAELSSMATVVVKHK